MRPDAHPREALVALLYDELEGAEARSVRAHLDGCPECTAALESYRAVRRAASGLPRELPSAAGLDSLLHYAALAQRRRTRRRRVALWTGWLLSGAGAVAWVLLAVQPPGAREPSARVSSASAVGALAKNDAAPTLAPPPSELAEELPPQRGAAGGASLRASSAKKTAAPSVRAESPRVRAQAAPPAAAQGAATSSPPEERSAPAAVSTATDARADLVPPLGTGGRPVSKALSAPAGAPAPSAAVSPSAGPAFAARAAVRAGPDAGEQQRLEDEARRQAILQKLPGASGAEALALLSELCALEVRLQHREEAARACGAVVADAPGTPEAGAAQAQLKALLPP